MKKALMFFVCMSIFSATIIAQEGTSKKASSNKRPASTQAPSKATKVSSKKAAHKQAAAVEVKESK